MTDYCTLEQIKAELELKSTDSDYSDYDTELALIRDTQEALIDLYLADFVTVPLTTVPERVSQICAELCRIKFRSIRAPDVDHLNVQNSLKKSIINDLEFYIKKTYETQDAIVIEEDRDDYE